MITISIGENSRILVVDAETGEPLDQTELLDAGRDAKADLYRQLRALSSNLSTFATQVKLELEELHKDGEIVSTGYYGGVKLTRSLQRRWDPKRVTVVLQRLVDEGVLKAARAEAAAPTVEVVKPDGRKLNVLLQELVGTDAGADLASTKTDTVSWTAEDTTAADAEPVPAGPAGQADRAPDDRPGEQAA